MDGRDVAVALVLGLGFWALYSLTFQHVPYGDGPFLAKNFYCLRDDRSHWAGVEAAGFFFTPGYWHHPLQLMIASALGRWFDQLSPLAILRQLSSAPGAAGIALAYGLCRAWNTPRTAALIAALLLALSPAYWFFSTTIEVHALHGACVVLCACVTVCAPWRRPVLASLIVAIFLPLLFLSHQSALLLGPGFVLLSQLARWQSTGRSFRLPTLLLCVGPLYLSSFLAAIVISAWLRGTPLAEFFSWSSHTVDRFSQGFVLQSVYDGWLQPLGALLPLAALALALQRLRGLALATTMVLVLPSMFFFLVWGMVERGGYTLGTAGFLCAAAATALPARPWRALAVGVLLIALQGTLAYQSLRVHDNPVVRERLERRAAAVARVIPEKGTLLSINTHFQFVETFLPDVIELSFYGQICGTDRIGGTPADFMARVGPLIEAQLARPKTVVALDLSSRALFEARAPRFVPYLDALEAWLSTRCQITRFEDPQWPMALLH